MLMALIEIIWGGSLLAIIVTGCIYAVSPAARRRLLRDGHKSDGGMTAGQREVAKP